MNEEKRIPKTTYDITLDSTREREEDSQTGHMMTLPFSNGFLLFFLISSASIGYYIY